MPYSGEKEEEKEQVRLNSGPVCAVGEQNFLWSSYRDWAKVTTVYNPPSTELLLQNEEKNIVLLPEKSIWHVFCDTSIITLYKLTALAAVD